MNNINIYNTYISPKAIDIISETLNSTFISEGKLVKQFEDEFARYCGNKYCVGLASGLDALYLSLKACDFREGDEVIVPSNTYIATILSILNAGLKPVLAEPDIRTYNIDPKNIEAKISSRTRAAFWTSPDFCKEREIAKRIIHSLFPESAKLRSYSIRASSYSPFENK